MSEAHRYLGKVVRLCKPFQQIQKVKMQALTFQKWLEGWNLLQFDDIRIIADVPGGLGALSYNHDVIHLGSMLSWRRSH